MVLAWLMGMRGATTGAATVSFLTEGSVPTRQAALDEATMHPDRGIKVVVAAAQLRAIADHRHTTLPLSLARTILSLLLIAGAAFVISGRRGARSFAGQVIAANVALAVAEFALTYRVRAAWIGEVPALAAELPGLPVDVFKNGRFWWWAERVQFAVFELGGLLFSLFAVYSKRSRGFFDATQRVAAEERRSTDDEL